VAWATSISDISAPTVAELDAALNVTTRITPDGLNITPDTATVDNSHLASTFTTSRAGRRSFSNAVTFKRGDTAQDDLPHTTLKYQVTGYLVVRRTLPYTTAWAAGQEVVHREAQAGHRAVEPPLLVLHVLGDEAPDGLGLPRRQLTPRRFGRRLAGDRRCTSHGVNLDMCPDTCLVIRPRAPGTTALKARPQAVLTVSTGGKVPRIRHFLTTGQRTSSGTSAVRRCRCGRGALFALPLGRLRSDGRR
jgi:hypothetical protein